MQTKLNPANNLVRYQLLEAIVRLAQQKFQSSQGIADSVRRVFQDYLNNVMSRFDSNKFRFECLLNKQCSELY